MQKINRHISILLRGFVPLQCFLLSLFFTSALLSFFAFHGFCQQLPPQKKQNIRILFLLDASGSMKEKWGKEQKFTTAKKVIRQMVDSLRKEKNIEVAMRVFGHQSPRSEQNCNDTKLEVPFSKSGFVDLLKKLNDITPQGYTPIELSLNNAIEDFSKADTKNIIILITDGIENCTGDPCAAAANLQKAGIFLRPYVVGLGLSEEHQKRFDCVGQVYDIKEEKVAKTVTNIIITNVLNPTTLQVNLLNEYGKPTETNLNMTFYDALNKTPRYNIYHTINSSGNPDTLYLDPVNTYQLKVHSLPPVKKNEVKMTPGKHTTTAADVPQGSLRINSSGASKYKNLKVRVTQKGKPETLNYQDANYTQNYLTGIYEVEVLTLPRIVFDSVQITQGKTTSYTVASPGSLSVSAASGGYIAIFSIEADGMLSKIYSIDPSTQKDNVTMQPGNYTAIYRTKNATSTSQTKETRFVITSGAVTAVRF